MVKELLGAAISYRLFLVVLSVSLRERGREGERGREAGRNRARESESDSETERNRESMLSSSSRSPCSMRRSMLQATSLLRNKQARSCKIALPALACRTSKFSLTLTLLLRELLRSEPINR